VGPEERVITFVGRFVTDKGVVELLDAHRALRAEDPRARLLLVGADIGGEALESSLVERARSSPGVVLTGTMSDLAPVYAATDVLAFPSHREGFPNVVLEAAAAGLPTVGFRVTGTRDGVVDGVTGTLVDPQDIAGFTGALRRYLDDDVLRAAHGAAARRRAEQELSADRVWNGWLDLYRRRLTVAGRPPPLAG
jgi:glycosyltransferase involved in cell wall biosynthesis